MLTVILQEFFDKVDYIDHRKARAVSIGRSSCSSEDTWRESSRGWRCKFEWQAGLGLTVSQHHSAATVSFPTYAQRNNCPKTPNEISAALTISAAQMWNMG